MNLAFKRWVSLIETHGFKDIAIYGIGDLGQEAYSSLLSENVRIKLFIDKLAQTQSLAMYNIPVISPVNIVSESLDVILISSERFGLEIKNSLFSLYQNVDNQPQILTMFPEALIMERVSYLHVDSVDFWKKKSVEFKEKNQLYTKCSELLYRDIVAK